MSHKPGVSDDGQRAFLNLAGEDGEIDSYELQDILNRFFVKDFSFDGFSIDMARSLVATRDFDLSGKLDYDDFKRLWSDLALCKKAFMVLDTDDSGSFSVSEFGRAVDALGMSASEGTLKAMMTRYADKDGMIKFDDFVACYVKLKTMQKTFQAKDVNGDGEVEFSIDEYVQLGIYS